MNKDHEYIYLQIEFCLLQAIFARFKLYNNKYKTNKAEKT